MTTTNFENNELEAMAEIDNSAVARAMLKKTGIQAVLDREDITEVAVNQGGVILLRGKMAGSKSKLQNAPIITSRR